MNNIINLLDELIYITQAEDAEKDPRSLKKKNGSESFMVSKLKLLKESILEYDNCRTDKRT
jgi:hypothetical protein